MLLQCKHCGAPLDIKPSEQLARCRYCNTTSAPSALRTVAVQTPPDWRPPPKWTPPPEFPAGPAPLQYHPGKPTTFGLIMVIITVGPLLLGLVSAAVFSIRSKSGKSASMLQSGLPIARLGNVSLAQSREKMMALLGGQPDDDHKLRIELAGGVWTAITFEWDPAHPDHVLKFYVNTPSPHPQHAQVYARLQAILPPRFDGDHFRWNGASLYYASKGGVLSVNVEPEKGHGNNQNPHWRKQAETMWSVIQSAAFELPVKPDPNAIRDYLGGGYPLTTIAQVDFEADIDASPAAVAKVFPGVAPSKFIGLSYEIALNHPHLGVGVLEWENKAGAKMKELMLRPRPPKSKLDNQDQFAACVEQSFGVKPKIYEGDYLAKDKDYSFNLKEGGHIRVYNHLIMVNMRDYPFARPMPKAAWEKTLAVLDACGRGK